MRVLRCLLAWRQVCCMWLEIWRLKYRNTGSRTAGALTVDVHGGAADDHKHAHRSDRGSPKCAYGKDISTAMLCSHTTCVRIGKGTWPSASKRLNKLPDIHEHTDVPIMCSGRSQRTHQTSHVDVRSGSHGSVQVLRCMVRHVFTGSLEMPREDQESCGVIVGPG